MLNNLFTGIFDAAGTAVISVPDFLLCIVVSLVIGAFITWVYTYKSRYTTSFAVTLAMLPAIVCIVIMMVNGNVGAGVAVAGAFSLVRFRSVPGTAKEIGTIFLAMAALPCNGRAVSIYKQIGGAFHCLVCNRAVCVKQLHIQISGNNLVFTGSYGIGKPRIGGTDEHCRAQQYRENTGKQCTLCAFFLCHCV